MPDLTAKKKQSLWYNLILSISSPGLVSILHRVSGAMLFLATRVLYLFELSLPPRAAYGRRATPPAPIAKVVVIARSGPPDHSAQAYATVPRHRHGTSLHAATQRVRSSIVSLRWQPSMECACVTRIIVGRTTAEGLAGARRVIARRRDATLIRAVPRRYPTVGRRTRNTRPQATSASEAATPLRPSQSFKP